MRVESAASHPPVIVETWFYYIIYIFTNPLGGVVGREIWQQKFTKFFTNLVYSYVQIVSSPCTTKVPGKNRLFFFVPPVPSEVLTKRFLSLKYKQLWGTFVLKTLVQNTSVFPKEKGSSWNTEIFKKKEIKSMVAFSEFDTLKNLWIEPLLSVRVCIVGADGEFWFHLLRFCCGVFLYLNLGTMRLREIGGERRRGIENPAELNIPVSRCNSQSSPWSGVENDSIGLCNSIKSPNKDFSVREFWTFSPTKTCSCWISLFISVFIRNRKKKSNFFFFCFTIYKKFSIFWKRKSSFYVNIF